MSLGLSSTRESLRWLTSAGIVLAAHVGLAVGLLARAPDDQPGGPSGAFVIELAAAPIARADVPDNVAPGPDQTEAASAVERKAQDTPVEERREEPPPAPEPEVALPSPVREKPHEEVEQVAQAGAAMTTATQAVAERVAETAAAPVIGAPSTTPSISLPTWKSKVETLLERSKRYPGISQARQEEGVVHVSFVIDRNGHLLGSRIEKSSGFEALDGEALALLTRAQPFPSLPAEISGAHARLSVPIRFKLK